MLKPTEDEVRQAIETSGYPLEIRVANTLVNSGFFEVTPSWEFQDDKTGESREIDVAAWQPFEVMNEGTHCQPVMLNLLIECKRSPAFVVYSTQPTSILTGLEYDAMSLCYFGRPSVLWRSSKYGWGGTDVIHHLNLGVRRWKWPSCVGTHYSFVHAIKEHNSGGKSSKRPRYKVGDEEFYQRKLLALIKAAYKYREPYVWHNQLGPGFVQPHFVVPLLVVEADLYEYDVSTRSLKTISRAAICKSYRGEFAARFRIDVVREEELTTYLGELCKDFSGIAAQIGKEQVLWQKALDYEHAQVTQKRREGITPEAAP